ncbi:hypothetical protein EJ06DRAFT_168970 [Trichodelitschia bisporula]|uniref:Uncharacterized protein n=1 Tax=Trichodelitschia bisporula TaxID=703511 RepID=A0A6G1HMM7_9PEZI|nr:hypothetical protein EJ06DRAFT_168970 [Trichodelitschia bisporula]
MANRGKKKKTKSELKKLQKALAEQNAGNQAPQDKNAKAMEPAQGENAKNIKPPQDQELDVKKRANVPMPDVKKHDNLPKPATPKRDNTPKPKATTLEFMMGTSDAVDNMLEAELRYAEEAHKAKVASRMATPEKFQDVPTIIGVAPNGEEFLPELAPSIKWRSRRVEQMKEAKSSGDQTAKSYTDPNNVSSSQSVNLAQGTDPAEVQSRHSETL